MRILPTTPHSFPQYSILHLTFCIPHSPIPHFTHHPLLHRVRSALCSERSGSLGAIFLVFVVDPDKWEHWSLAFIVAIQIFLIMLQTFAVKTGNIWSKRHHAGLHLFTYIFFSLHFFKIHYLFIRNHTNRQRKMFSNCRSYPGCQWRLWRDC